jgi:type IV pilus assembly protein PilB
MIINKYKGSVVQIVASVIEDAIRLRASDIHLEPFEHTYLVRFRFDGVLKEMARIDLSNKDSITSRLKILANLDIAEKRRPQDGRIRFQMADQWVDIRMSIMPTAYGEKIVLRILDRSTVNLSIDSLGMEPDQKQALLEGLSMPYGMILVTGPTGSGKTTTLYAGLNHLNREQVNISTIEDPIEYNLDGINQTQVNTDIGVSFAAALRALLRQDPNIIMVGEIRDRETADIAIRASLTGHLVLSTIHTNDSASTVTRLNDMGIESYLSASSLRLIIAQRLVRCICGNCKQVVTDPDPSVLKQLQVEQYSIGSGCEVCYQTGYKGRTALFELMPIHAEAERMMVMADAESALREYARRNGFKTLREHGIALIRSGITTPEEVIRETKL